MKRSAAAIQISPEEAFDALGTGVLRGPASKAWELFDRAWPALDRRLAIFLRSLGVPENLREDCGQTALLRVWKARETYRGASPGELAAWIHTICRRESLRLYEAEGRTPRTESEMQRDTSNASPTLEALGRPGTNDPESDNDPTASAVEALDAGRALEECLGALSPKHREVVELFYSTAGGTERAVAGLLDIPKSTVHVIRKEALARLCTCLEGKGGV